MQHDQVGQVGQVRWRPLMYSGISRGRVASTEAPVRPGCTDRVEVLLQPKLHQHANHGQTRIVLACLIHLAQSHEGVRVRVVLQHQAWMLPPQVPLCSLRSARVDGCQDLDASRGSQKAGSLSCTSLGWLPGPAQTADVARDSANAIKNSSTA